MRKYFFVKQNSQKAAVCSCCETHLVQIVLDVQDFFREEMYQLQSDEYILVDDCKVQDPTERKRFCVKTALQVELF